jgi:large subunit ribosomal protein L15
MSDYNPVLSAPEGANKKKRIIGRGSSSGRGTTAGRGNKGQQSRSGGKTYIGFEGGQMPLYRRIAHRGFSNYPYKKEYVCFNISDLEAKYADGETVDRTSLYTKGLLKGNAAYIKVLGDGSITKKLTVHVDKISASAKEKIEKAGGSVTVKEPAVVKEAEKTETKPVKTTATAEKPAKEPKTAKKTAKKAEEKK